MATNTAQVQVRQDPRQVANTLKKTINFNDPDRADSAFELGLPQSAFIMNVWMEVVTAFDGGAGIVVGTVGAAYNNIISAADANEAVAGVYIAARSVGRGLTASGPVIPHSVMTGAPTVGQAIVLIEYEGGWRT